MAPHGTARRHSQRLAAAGGAPRMRLFEKRDVIVGEQWEGLISKITDYGFFVRMGHEQHVGLCHIKGLARDRLPRDEIPDWIEENVGPVGSKVQVEVERINFKGEKRTSLKLLDVIERQRMEDLVFAPGPRREMSGYGDEDEEYA